MYTDHHIHIGQFNEVYYDALQVFEIIDSLAETTGVTRLCYSSTSSCRDDAELVLVEEEIAYAQSYNSTFNIQDFIVEPYLWFLPKYAEQGISVTSATKSFDYCGIKLHPAGQNWDLQKKTHNKAFHQIFQWASDYNKSILIHCGTMECDLPTRFQFFFQEYPKAKVILAHSNPVEETAQMVNKYKNIFCDIACTEEKNIHLLKSKIQESQKILFGSDFPINHYFNVRLFEKTHSLQEQYLQDCSRIKLLTTIN